MANGKGRDRQREARWRRIVREQGRSGLGVREFCRRGKLTETALYYWRRELGRRQAEQEQRSHEPPAVPAFVPVRVTEHVGGPAVGRIEIELSSGRRVHVSGPVDRAALADVLAVLATASPERLEARPC